jgi:hypothetical protein
MNTGNRQIVHGALIVLFLDAGDCALDNSPVFTIRYHHTWNQTIGRNASEERVGAEETETRVLGKLVDFQQSLTIPACGDIGFEDLARGEEGIGWGKSPKSAVPFMPIRGGELLYVHLLLWSQPSEKDMIRCGPNYSTVS